MKKLIYILPACLFYIQCSAQRLTPGEFKGKNETITVQALKPFDTVHYIFVSIKNDKYHGGIPILKKNPFPVLAKDFKVNTEAVNPIVFKILGEKLNLLKQNKEDMNIDLTFNHSGKVVTVGFGLRANTLITVKDIEEINKELRKNIKAVFTGSDYLGYEVNHKFMPMIVF